MEKYTNTHKHTKKKTKNHELSQTKIIITNGNYYKAENWKQYC